MKFYTALYPKRMTPDGCICEKCGSRCRKITKSKRRGDQKRTWKVFKYKCPKCEK